MYYIKTQNDQGEFVDAQGVKFDVIKANDFYPAEHFTDYCQSDSLSQSLVQMGLTLVSAKIIEPFVAQNYRYSRLKVFDALSAAGIALTQMQLSRMSMANDLGFDDEMFAQMYADLKENGFDVDAVLKGCVL